MPNNSATAEQRDLVLEIDRVFAAPRELIWRLWQDPEHMVRWYGPEGCALTVCDSDFRVGGTWRRCMTTPTGHEHWIWGHYLEIDQPQRLSFTYVNAADGFETVVTLAFLEAGRDRTRMLFRQTPFISLKERDGHGRGWNSSLDLLARYVAQFVELPDWRPVGRPRVDGVAEDMIAARQRQQDKQEEETTRAHAAKDH
jgi:uncharacterized protein YndB with AHSA1/START domain